MKTFLVGLAVLAIISSSVAFQLNNAKSHDAQLGAVLPAKTSLTGKGPASGTGVSGKADVSTAPSCKCPYKVVVVGGTGSTSTHPIFASVAKVAPGASNIALSNGAADNLDWAKAKMQEIVDQNKAAGRKTLVVGHSLGGVLAINQFQGQSCVEVLPIDPPVGLNGFVCNKFNGLFNQACREIVRAKKCVPPPQKTNSKDRLVGGRGVGDKASNVCTPYWCTDGTCKPMKDHDPYSAGNQTKIDEINATIKAKIDSCAD